jgi:hypothetical protein
MTIHMSHEQEVPPWQSYRAWFPNQNDAFPNGHPLMPFSYPFRRSQTGKAGVTPTFNHFYGLMAMVHV